MFFMAYLTQGSGMTDPVATSPWRDVWRQFRTHRGALIGMIVFLLIIVGVWIGPFVWRVDPSTIDILARDQGPSWSHPFGTDELGRDTLARVLAGGQISIAVGLTAMLVRDQRA